MDYNNQDGGYNRRPYNSNFRRADSTPRYSAEGDNNEGASRPRFNGNSGDRRPRQRFSAPRQGGNYERASYNNDNQGYSPRHEGGYRPRYNGQQEGGYQQRPRFNHEGGDYQSRPRFRQEGDGQSYNPRPRFNQEGGDYQPRPRFRQEGEGQSYGQRPRFNNPNGNQGGYNNRPSYSKQRAKSSNPNAKYSAKKRMEYEEKYEDPTKPIRLNKYLANAGICSRREADDFIQAGVITVNGLVVSELGAKVLPTDVVKFHEQPVRREKKVYILLNKPKNTVTTTDDPQERHTVIDLVKNACPERIYPVGRLDRNTTGVLLLTNDGDLAAKLTHPKFGKKKIYAATLDKELTDEAYNEIMAGITLDDEVIIPDALAFPKDDERKHVGIQIHSGQNRVVRRVFEKVGYKVIALDRVSFAGLTKKNVPRGKYRFLTQEEVNMLQMGAFE